MFVLLLILSAALVHSLSPNGTIPIKIGILLDFDNTSSSSINDVVAMYVRAHQLNLNSSLIHPNATLQLSYYNAIDSASDLVTQAFDYASQDNVIALIGAEYSSDTALISYIVQGFGIPQCSGSATNPHLGDKSIYPNFFRTIAHDDVGSKVFADYVSSMGWTNVFVIYSDESYGQGYLASFQIDAAAKGITVDGVLKVGLSATVDDPTVVQGIKYIQTLSTKVFLFFCQSAPMAAVVTALNNVGLWSKSYAYLCSDTCTILDPSLVGTNLVDGLVVIDPSSGSGPAYDNFQAYYQQHAAQTPYVNETGYDSTLLGFYSPFFVGCLDMLIFGFDRLLKSDPSYNVQMLSNGTLNQYMVVPDTFSFPDVTSVIGQLNLDSNGDRAGSFWINNYKNGGQFVITGSWTDGVISQISTVVWPGGTTTIPTGRIDYQGIATSLSYSTGIFWFGLILGIAGSVATLYAIIHLLTNLKNPSMKRLSPVTTAGMLFGVLLGFIDVAITSDQPSTAACGADVWLLVLGFSVFFGTMIIKRRIFYLIFSGIPVKRSIFSKDEMQPVVGLLCSIPNAILLLIWASIDSPARKLSIISPTVSYWTCSSTSTTIQSGMTGALLAYQVILLGLNVFFYLKSSNAPAAYKKMNSIMPVLITSITGLFVVVLIYASGGSYMAARGLKLFGVLVSCISGFYYTYYAPLTQTGSNRSSVTTRSVESEDENGKVVNKGINALIQSNQWTFVCKVMLTKKDSFLFQAPAKIKFFSYNPKIVAFLDYTMVEEDGHVKGSIASSGTAYILSFVRNAAVTAKTCNEAANTYNISFTFDNDNYIMSFVSINDYKETLKTMEQLVLHVNMKSTVLKTQVANQ